MLGIKKWFPTDSNGVIYSTFSPSLFNQFYLLLPNMRESYSTLLYFRDGKVTENIFCHRAGLLEKLYFS